MKKIIGAVLATVLVGLVAFQNCQQSPHPNDVTTTPLVDSNKLADLQSEKLTEVNFLISENETITRSSGSFSVFVNKNLQVSLDSGKIALTSDLNSTPEQYCLTETLLKELISILKSSQICNKRIQGEGLVCTQAVVLPYAILSTEKKTYNLGGANDGCGAPEDICGEQKDLLQGFIASIKANYKTLVCH